VVYQPGEPVLTCPQARRELLPACDNGGSDGDAAVSRWRQRLQDAPLLLQLLLDLPRPAVPGSPIGTISMQMPGALVADVGRAAEAEGSSLFNALLAAWQALMRRYTRADELVTGALLAGCSREGTSYVNGGSASLVPIRTDVPGTGTAALLLFMRHQGGCIMQCTCAELACCEAAIFHSMPDAAHAASACTRFCERVKGMAHHVQEDSPSGSCCAPWRQQRQMHGQPAGRRCLPLQGRWVWTSVRKHFPYTKLPWRCVAPAMTARR